MKINEAAKTLGVSISTVRRWIKSNKLVAVKRGRQWFIEVEEVERVRREGLVV